MTRENVALLHRTYDAIQRNDADDFLQAMHPEVQGFSYTMSAEGQVYRGHDGMRRFFADVHEVFPDWHPRIGEVVDRGDVVAAEIAMSARAAASGVEVEQTVWQVVVFSDGKVVFWHGYPTREAALAAADEHAGRVDQRSGTSTKPPAGAGSSVSEISISSRTQPQSQASASSSSMEP